MELQDRVEELQSAGIGVAAISYDSKETLAAFAERRNITFPLLSDDDSSTIKEYGILNNIVTKKFYFRYSMTSLLKIEGLSILTTCPALSIA